MYETDNVMVTHPRAELARTVWRKHEILGLALNGGDFFFFFFRSKTRSLEFSATRTSKC